MKMMTVGPSDLESSRLVYGCMRIAGDGENR
jgi:aryl-alcohol dehydrogenase-like predicted oxidoreductase